MRMPVTSGASEILKQQRQRIARIQAQNAELTHELVQDSKAQRLLSNKMLSKDVQQSKTDIEQYLRKVRLEELVIKDTTSTISTLIKSLRNQSRAKV
jgi:glutamine synthetase adenylyltransferase